MRGLIALVLRNHDIICLEGYADKVEHLLSDAPDDGTATLRFCTSIEAYGSKSRLEYYMCVDYPTEGLKGHVKEDRVDMPIFDDELKRIHAALVELNEEFSDFMQESDDTKFKHDGLKSGAVLCLRGEIETRAFDWVRKSLSRWPALGSRRFWLHLRKDQWVFRRNQPGPLDDSSVPLSVVK